MFELLPSPGAFLASAVWGGQWGGHICICLFGVGGKNSGWYTYDWVSDVIWHQLAAYIFSGNTTLWIQLLCNPATLQPLSLGGGGHREPEFSQGGAWPLATPYEPPLAQPWFPTPFWPELYPAVCFRGSMKLSGGTIEWPKRRVREGSEEGVPPPQGWGSGGVTRENFWNLRRNLVQSGAFWQEVDVFPVFHLCERKHCLMLDSGIDTVAYYFNFLVVWMPSVSCCSSWLACSGRVSCCQIGTPPWRGGVDNPFPGGSKFVSGGVSTPRGWLDKPLILT